MDNRKKPIAILREEVASQIAAGEVIERPTSVVKELVENAIDAGAQIIAVSIEAAGRKSIEVSDDGSGIESDQIRLAVTRHATSKLSSADQLFSIRTLGFRGEALASIASVSQFVILSRSENETLGIKLTIEGGKEISCEKIGAPVGSSISVKNLFYSVPARLKFLKSETTEKQRISALMMRYGLAYPQIRFKLDFDGKTVFQTNGNGDRREILVQLYGLEIAKKMLEVRLQDGDYSVNGYISPIAITKSNRKDIIFFANGRWVQDAALSSAVLKAYQTMIMVGRFPITVLFLDIPTDQIDVNVHPTKAEVRFQQPDAIFSLVQRAVRRALLAYNPVPQLSSKLWGGYDSQNSSEETSWTSASNQVNGENPASFFSSPEGFPGTHESTQTTGTVFHSLPLLRLIGQIGATYIVAEGPDGLYLVDQHAAHERVLFEKLISQMSSKIPSQSLLNPEVITLPPNQAQILSGRLEILNKLGFIVQEFGNNSFQVRAIPALLLGLEPQAALWVVVEDFEDDETPLQQKTEEIIAARVCKRAAVKAGQILTRPEQEALLADLERCRSPRTCPHGRPTMVHLSVELLEKQFGRKGSL